jgi:chorismate synthase
MGNNTFGQLFTITTWGESHGKEMGVIIDGCPSNLSISREEIEKDLLLRRGDHFFSTHRREKDSIEIVSGIFNGKTTGAPISIIIKNTDVDSSDYEKNKNLLRPNHANYTYLEKYGIFDYRGGGRASARETVCRVAAGSIAKKILKKYHIETLAYLKSLHQIEAQIPHDFALIKKLRNQSPLLCPDKISTEKMLKILETTKEEKDSVGAVIECTVPYMISGLGDPIYQKVSSKLAHAIFSIPGVQGFEIGEGFHSSYMKGSEYHDHFFMDKNKKIKTKTNHCGGLQAGISNGMPIIFRLALKPTSTIEKPIKTITHQGKASILNWKNFRHDCCIALRAIPVVEAMTNLVLVDSLLMQKSISL